MCNNDKGIVDLEFFKQVIDGPFAEDSVKLGAIGLDNAHSADFHIVDFCSEALLLGL